MVAGSLQPAVAATAAPSAAVAKAANGGVAGAGVVGGQRARGGGGRAAPEVGGRGAAGPDRLLADVREPGRDADVRRVAGAGVGASGASWVRPDASLVQGADGSWSPAAAAAALTL